MRRARFRTLSSLHSRGVNLVPPHVNGVQVDLFKLYDTVQSLGGWQRVTQQDKWFDAAQAALGLGEDIAGADHCTKLLYMRYLAKYEQSESAGDQEDHEPELGSRGRLRGFSLYATSECPVNTSRRGESFL